MVRIPQSAVLLPIDMQRGFDRHPAETRANPAVDRNALALIGAWRASGRTVIHVRHDSVEPDSVLRPGELGHYFRPGFDPFDGEAVVAKSVNAAFIGTDLDLRLRRLGAELVVAFGFQTDMCVSTTVRVGANLGWRMMMVGDACDCFDLPDGAGGTIPAATVHAAHLATIRAEFAEVVDAETVIRALFV